MADTNRSNIAAAFEILLEEIEAEIELSNGTGAKAFQDRDYRRAQEVVGRAKELTAFREKVTALRKEWGSLKGSQRSSASSDAGVRRRIRNRLPRGVRTPQEAYYIPILQTLDRLGGSGAVNPVLEAVERLMRGTLKEVDYEAVESEKGAPRWRNAAQWARNMMVKEGLLKADSPYGVWQISDAGRRHLAAFNGTLAQGVDRAS